MPGRHIKNILSLPLTLYDFEFLCIYKRITKEKIKNIFFCGVGLEILSFRAFRHFRSIFVLPEMQCFWTIYLVFSQLLLS